jgi:alkanesulfonate monooxygenase SsuD/methylene tetrahydromethanopterin reductase-like flavin-dependent oxidoreductase (luciferase family)
MQYGVYLPNFGPFGSARAMARLASEAEAAGWDGFFVWDHIAGFDQPFVDPWIGLTAVALATTRIRLGTTVTPLPRRRPWKLAREAASLDEVSDGRLVLGVGIGLGEPEWSDLGEEADSRVRGAMLDEALEILSGLWTGERFSYDGAYYRVHDARFLPVPVQRPRIPIWVGGFWPGRAPFRRMARWDGMFPLFSGSGNADDDVRLFARAVAYVQRERRSAAPFDVIAMGLTPEHDSGRGRQVVSRYEASGATWWLEIIAPFRIGLSLDDPCDAEALWSRVLEGPPR